MKVVSVNLPESYIDAIKKLIGDGENALYHSRSELIRCAVRDLLIKEIQIAKNLNHSKRSKLKKTTKSKKKTKSDNTVSIPIETKNDNGDPVKEIKTYKIIRRLEVN